MKGIALRAFYMTACVGISYAAVRWPRATMVGGAVLWVVAGPDPKKAHMQVNTQMEGPEIPR